MKGPIFIIIILVVVSGFFILLKWLERSKRKTEKSATDIESLSPRKLSKTMSLTGSGNLGSLADWLQQQADCRISHRSDSELIAFWGEAASSKFEGVLNTPPEAMPVRISARESGNKVEVTIAEDYGFQMFVGPAKAAFSKKYQQAFEIIEENIRKTLS
jgi:hypothetical protein